MGAPRACSVTVQCTGLCIACFLGRRGGTPRFFNFFGYVNSMATISLMSAFLNALTPLYCLFIVPRRERLPILRCPGLPGLH